VKSYALIVNPTSGRGLALRKAEANKKALSDSSSVEILETTHRGAASELAAGSAGQVDRVIAVGGDGTLNEVLDGLMRSGLSGPRLPELGFLPAGTGNAAVKAFGLGTDPDSVARTLASAEGRPLDVGMVRHEGGERAFLLWFGAGWDGVIIHALNTSRSGLMGVSGLLGHAPQVIRAMVGYDQPPITAEVDGSSFGVHSSVIVANVAEMAFGSMVAEGADPWDGQFNVVALPRLSVLRSTRLGFKMMTSSLTRAPGVKHGPGAEIRLESDGAVPFQLDGEPVGTLPATVTLVPGAVRFLGTHE
jgi:diacylglycerol kinase (ATP)